MSNNNLINVLPRDVQLKAQLYVLKYIVIVRMHGRTTASCNDSRLVCRNSELIYCRHTFFIICYYSALSMERK